MSEKPDKSGSDSQSHLGCSCVGQCSEVNLESNNQANVWRIFLFRVRLRTYDCLLAFAVLYSAREGRLRAEPLHY